MNCFSCDIGFFSGGGEETLCNKTICPPNLFPSMITGTTVTDGCVDYCPPGAVLYNRLGDGSDMSCPLCPKGM